MASPETERLRILDEAAAYARCHGDRDDSVRVVKLPPRRARYDSLLATGEEIRRGLESRIDARDGDSKPRRRRRSPARRGPAGRSLHSLAARPIRLVA